MNHLSIKTKKVLFISFMFRGNGGTEKENFVQFCFSGTTQYGISLMRNFSSELRPNLGMMQKLILLVKKNFGLKAHPGFDRKLLTGTSKFATAA